MEKEKGAVKNLVNGQAVLAFTISILSGLLPLDPPCHPIRRPSYNQLSDAAEKTLRGISQSETAVISADASRFPWRLGSALPFHPDSRSLNAAVTSP